MQTCFGKPLPSSVRKWITYIATMTSIYIKEIELIIINREQWYKRNP